jgi:hypothetical protein
MALGDVTAVGFPERARTTGHTNKIFWVYRNVSACVTDTGGSGDEVLPLARAVQAFMERSLTCLGSSDQ